MYNVSQAYLNQIKKPYALKRTLRGTIGNVSFTEDDILSGSFSVSNQCSDANEVKIGSVNVGELEVTFRSNLLSRNQWKGAVITVSDGLFIDTLQQYEYVPLGIYTIDDAKIDKTGIRVHAYDNMLKFDKSFNLSTTTGSAYSILALMCQDCGVELGMTETQMAALPNGTQQISLYSENDCETYRDVVFWIAQTVGCFATIGRDGKLYLRKYGNTEIDSISAGLRFDDNLFATYQTQYSGIGLTNIDDDEYIYVKEGEDTKLPYNLGANPFIQYGTDSTRKQMLLNILRQLKVIDYVPFETSMLHCPAYDLGDVIEFTGGIADDTKHSCIMFYEYNFEYYAAEGYGSDPALANAKSKTDKNIAGLKSKTDKNSIQFYTFKNADEIVVGDNQTKQLMNIRFATAESKQVTFQAEILCDADVTVDDIKANILYYLDRDLITDYQPVETWSEDGKHIISLYYMIDVEPNTLYQWQVMMKSEGGTIVVPVENARGTIWGQGLVASDKWNGFIDVEDEVGAIPLDSILVATFTDACSVSAQEPISRAIADMITGIQIDDNIAVAQFEDYVLMNKTSIYLEEMTWQDVYASTWGAIYDEHTW